MGRVVLDADVLIAFLDPADAQHERAVPLVRSRLAAGDELLVSASVYAEILVRPLGSGTDAVIDDFIEAVGIEVVSIDRTIARSAAKIRAAHGSLRLPDALCLAVAVANDAELVTFDEPLARVDADLRRSA